MTLTAAPTLAGGPAPPKFTMLRGTNVDAGNAAAGAHPVPKFLSGINFNAIRLVCKPGGDAELYAESCVKAGLFVMGAITGESQGQLLYNCHIYQLRNEIDIVSPSSEGIIPPAEYAAEVRLFCATYPDLKFVLGSLAAGDFAARYLRELLLVLGPTLPSNLVGWSIHPYAKGLSEARLLIEAHQAVIDARGLNLGCYVTEWNRPTNEIPGFDWYLRTKTKAAFWFCTDDDMVAGFGLMHGGKPKPELAAFGPFNANPVVKPPPQKYAPQLVTWDWLSPWDNGAYPARPLGWLIHGSRSGVAHLSTAEEFWATAHFTHARQDGLAYQAVIGDDMVAMGLPDGHWGWHARGSSSVRIGYELAQPVEAAAISDAQVRALVWRMVKDRAVFPGMALDLRTHAMVDGTPEYGRLDGKSDVFGRGSPRWDELKGRILAECARQGLKA